MSKTEELKKEVGVVLDNVVDWWRSKEKGTNPYHWFNEGKETFIEQIMAIFIDED